MRSIAPPLVSNQRLARLLTWARLWLAWVAGVLAGFVGGLPAEAERNVCEWLDQCADLLAQVIFLRALYRRLPGGMPARSQRYKEPVARRRYAGLRTVLGSALRRALRGKGARAKLRALIYVVQKAEAHIARLARRLARGLTRRCGFALAPDHVVGALAAAWMSPVVADTS